MHFAISHVSEITSISKQVISFNKPIICLSGEIGAGKTTFAKSLIWVFFQNHGYEITEEITSPTFNILHIYDYRNCRQIESSNNKPTNSCPIVWHFDLYRIKEINEIEELGIDEILDSFGLIIIEWPELILRRLINNIEIKEKLLNIKIINQAIKGQYIYEILEYRDV